MLLQKLKNPNIKKNLTSFKSVCFQLPGKLNMSDYHKVTAAINTMQIDPGKYDEKAFF